MDVELHCPNKRGKEKQRCNSTQIVKYGKVNGQQRYKCKDCGHTFVLYDRRHRDGTEIAQAIALLFNEIADPYAEELEELSERDRALLYRWGVLYRKSRCHHGSLLSEYDLLPAFWEQNKTKFSPDAERKIFAAAGKIGHGKYTVMLVVQKNENKK